MGFDIVSTVPAPVLYFISATIALFAIWFLIAVVLGRDRTID